jgi:hypothetical protein
MSDADTEPVDADVSETTSTSLRWQYTNDLLAGVIIGGYIALTVLDGWWIVDLAGLPTSWYIGYITIALVATAWAFGGAAVNAAATVLRR